MGRIIDELREIGSLEGYMSYGTPRDEKLEDVNCILGAYKPKDYTLKIVDSKFEDLGRWSNYETEIFEVIEGDDVAYFEFGREVPATESQDGMDLSYHFHEVVPKEVVKIIYVAKR